MRTEIRLHGDLRVALLQGTSQLVEELRVFTHREGDGVPDNLTSRRIHDCPVLGERLFDRRRPAAPSRAADLTSVRVEALMATGPAVCSPDTPIKDAGLIMRDRRISCLCVVADRDLVGILTLRDIVNKAVAEDLPKDTPISSDFSRMILR